ncbi:TPA: TIGR00730 family Rossman fold protein [Morganella morganii subsp. morganii]|uniref:Cytokinin riboside 5'-monophosphate phosphoribohydrolase n=1 Tax=Morganella morganii TaxID=582 RepID=A0AAU8ZGD9_MORMO|nr:TIGR00730 family Rossman fold protein [Morganella morganii]HDU8691979.1 TIGR00730 family Rossman fold protein [Morganella morganii subsp. morganii]AWC92218.1 TIGR00730 family Rossman fold protein [Morganella morganii]EKW8486616.1 TIGR00730 family Rossman fold protein [Morganella morganii]HAT3625979.1 TIGR00730 family Rossman fold protein [Morganella morganii]HCU0877743.1 TIGR00730 family Rossman fold protein [Morganella morganii]
MRDIKRIAVYCGSAAGASEIYRLEAVKFARILVEQGITLVYGGASVGIMGTVADTVLREGGKAIGVIPALLEGREIAHKNLTELYRVSTMHERKSKMIELADGFVALPGGFGTLEEFAEVFTWSQIGLHQKPVGLMNINNYYDPLLSLISKMTDEQFMQEKYRHMAIVETDGNALIRRFRDYEAPAVKTYD